MGNYPTVGLELLLRWAELVASTFLLALLAGVVLYVAVVLHYTHGDARRTHPAGEPHAAPGAGQPA